MPKAKDFQNFNFKRRYLLQLAFFGEGEVGVNWALTNPEKHKLFVYSRQHKHRETMSQQNVSGSYKFSCEKCHKKYKSEFYYSSHILKCNKSANAQVVSPQTEKNEKQPDEASILSTVSSTQSNNSQTAENVSQQPDNTSDNNISSKYVWGNYNSNVFEENLNNAYERIVHWKKNVFLLPSGKSGKEFIDEMTRLVVEWNNDSPLKLISLKALMVMPNLLLQKPSKSSKAKDHQLALERRLALWKNGDIVELILEAETIQNQLKFTGGKKTIAEISKSFRSLITKGEINSALKLLSDNMQNGILPLDSKTLNLLREKHPPPQDPDPLLLLSDVEPKIHHIRFETINAESIKTAATKTKGGSGPSGLDAVGWRRILASKSFGKSSNDLCTALAEMCKKLCSTEQDPESLEAFLACRLIPLDKNPGLRPIGIGEVLRRIIGKTITAKFKEDVMYSVGALQVCAGHEAGCEALVHAMRHIFDDESTEAVLLVDASNAFNSVNRNLFLHNIKIICPVIATFVNNCYASESRLFVAGGGELKSREGTTQGDPVAMATYAIATIPLILTLLEFSQNEGLRTKGAAYADDITAAGTLRGLRRWWDKLCQIGPNYGYFPNAGKTWIIVKENHLPLANEIFKGTGVKITSEGKRHLGAALGSASFRKSFMQEKVDEWVNEIRVLSQIAKTEPQAAYAAFIAGYKHKICYTMRTIPDIQQQLRPLDHIINTEFIPSITNGIVCSTNLRKLMALPPKLGGLGIPIFAEMARDEYENSQKLTDHLAKRIIDQEIHLDDDNEVKKIKQSMKSAKRKAQNEILENLRSQMSPNLLKLNELACAKGASSWLTLIPIAEEGYDLHKELFWDLMRIRYGYHLKRLPIRCECGCFFNLQHALSCKKGGFVSLRHNELRNSIAIMLDKICKDVVVEPALQPLTGEDLPEATAIAGDDARLDIHARGFWQTGQSAFFDIRVFNPLANRHVKHSLRKCFESNEREKKKAYNRRVLEIEHGSFTPLVFSATGGVGRECAKFITRLAEMVANKQDKPYGEVICWIRRKLSISLCKAVGICLRGSRAVFCRKDLNFNEDITTSLLISNIIE